MIASHDDIIVLDLATDRYLGLPAAIVNGGTPVAIGHGVRSLDPAAIAALIEAGLISIADGHARPASIGRPSHVIDCDLVQPTFPSLRDILDLGIALAVTGWRLWRHRPCQKQQTTRSEFSQLADTERLQRELARLKLLRLIVPTPRRCLPSALVTSLWLRRKGIPTEIVFGVRTHPFEAHCWAEYNGIVLDDDLDRLYSYTPITVGRP